MQTLLVGDVHACFEEFLELLDEASYDKNKHRLILLGDIINRGPHSLKMLEWARDQQVELIRGNHEEIFLQILKQKQQAHGRLEELKKAIGQDTEKWITYLESLPFYIEEPSFLAVHAGLEPGKHPKDTSPHTLMNIRTHGPDERAWYEFYQGEKLVIYGHWAKEGLKMRKNTIGLDSGCVYGNKLSGLLLPSKHLIQIPAKQNYLS